MQARIVEDAVTFDDVLLLPAHSEVLPSEADLATRLTPQCRLKIPIMSAAMDTVTEHAMAIALAKAGGVGVIHKNMSIEAQAAEVRKVKNYEAGVVAEPIWIGPRDTVREIQELSAQHGFGSFPVVDPETLEVLGIVTSRDIKYVSDLDLPAETIMTNRENIVTVKRSDPVPMSPMSSRLVGDLSPAAGDDTRMSPTISLTRGQVKSLMAKNRVEKVVVVDENHRLCGLITHGDFLKAEEAPRACRDGEGRLKCAAAVGCGPDCLPRVKALVSNHVDIICVDSSHGHSQGVLDTVRAVRREFPDICIVAGNTCTAEGALALVEAGASAVKVGVGPGSICTTRVVTGCGCPQMSAIANVAAALKDTNAGIIADGGLRYSGDIAKALAAGAHCVMLGSLLAGTDEAPGTIELFEGRAYKSYRGMGSEAAMLKGSADRYFQKVTSSRKLVPEGVEGRVAYKGPVAETLQVQIGGLQASMGLTGCRTITEMHNKIRFVRISGSGALESHPHSITITKEPPNYSLKR